MRQFEDFLECVCASRDLLSFPTRRSSDLSPGPSRLPARRRKGRKSLTWPRTIPTRPRRARRKPRGPGPGRDRPDRKSTRLNSSHVKILYAVFFLTKIIGVSIVVLESFSLI